MGWELLDLLNRGGYPLLERQLPLQAHILIPNEIVHNGVIVTVPYVKGTSVTDIQTRIRIRPFLHTVLSHC